MGKIMTDTNEILEICEQLEFERNRMKIEYPDGNWKDVNTQLGKLRLQLAAHIPELFSKHMGNEEAIRFARNYVSTSSN